MIESWNPAISVDPPHLKVLKLNSSRSSPTYAASPTHAQIYTPAAADTGRKVGFYMHMSKSDRLMMSDKTELRYTFLGADRRSSAVRFPNHGSNILPQESTQLTRSDLYKEDGVYMSSICRLAAVRRLPFLRNLPPGALIPAHFREGSSSIHTHTSLSHTHTFL